MTADSDEATREWLHGVHRVREELHLALHDYHELMGPEVPDNPEWQRRLNGVVARLALCAKRMREMESPPDGRLDPMAHTLHRMGTALEKVAQAPSDRNRWEQLSRLNERLGIQIQRLVSRAESAGGV